MKNSSIYLFLALIVCFNCFANEEHKEWLEETLNLLQEKFKFSTTLVEQVEYNKSIFKEETLS